MKTCGQCHYWQKGQCEIPIPKWIDYVLCELNNTRSLFANYCPSNDKMAEDCDYSPT